MHMVCLSVLILKGMEIMHVLIWGGGCDEVYSFVTNEDSVTNILIARIDKFNREGNDCPVRN